VNFLYVISLISIGVFLGLWILSDRWIMWRNKKADEIIERQSLYP